MTNGRNILSILIILSIAFLSYFNTFTNSFHFDDYTYILKNEGLKEYFQHPFSFSFILSNLHHRSIVFATLFLNHSLDGFNVFGFHILNLTVHIITCLLIFLIAKEILSINLFLKTSDQSKIKLNIPLISALLFAVHPINTQAITYITGRTTSLAVCFYMASFLFFIKGIIQNLPCKILFYALSIVFLILGFGSKIIILTAPVMFIVYYLFFTPLKATFFKRFFECKFIRIIIQTIAITSPFILIFMSNHLNLKDIHSFMDDWAFFLIHNMNRGFEFLEILRPFLGKLIQIGSMDNLGISIYLLTEFKVIVFYYIKMIFFPFNQNIDPDFPVAHGITDAGVALSLGVIVLCLFAGIYFYKKNRLIAFGIFWFFITLLPTSSILPLRDTATEHRLYLPLAGFIMTIPLYLNQFIVRYKKSSFKQLTYFILPVFLLIIVFSTLTVKRNFVWKDEKSLWSDAAEKSPRLSRPLNNLAEAYEKKAAYQKAIDSLKKAISLAPDDEYAHNNLGTVYGKLNQFDLAIKEYLHVLEVNDKFTEAHYNLGKSYEMKGMLDEAVQEYLKTIRQQHDFYQAYFNLASIYSKRKSYKEAISTYQEFLEYKPLYPAAYFELGKIYIKTKKTDMAFSYFSKALKLDSSYVPARIALGNIFMMRGSYDDAEEFFQQVLKLDPDNIAAHNNLGLIYLRYKNKPSQAVHYFQKSLKINPSQPDAKSVMEAIKKILNN